MDSYHLFSWLSFASGRLRALSLVSILSPPSTSRLGVRKPDFNYRLQGTKIDCFSPLATDMLDYHRQETAITTWTIKPISNTGSVALAPCPAGKVLFYTPIGLLAREEALTSTALIGLPGQLKDELESFPQKR